MQSLIISKSRLVSAEVTATPGAGQQYNFKTQADLENKNIMLYGVEAYSESQLAVDINGKTTVSADGCKNITLQLWDRDNKKVVEIPVTSLIRSNNGGLVVILKPFALDFSKCNIHLTAGTNISQNETVSFNFYYKEF